MDLFFPVGMNSYGLGKMPIFASMEITVKIKPQR